MSEENKPTSEKPNLTPEQEQQADDAQIQGKYAFVDMTERVSDLVDIFGPGAGYIALGKTAFDGMELNQLLDFVQRANPADLENAGEALENATTAINKAAKELNDFVRKTEWEGEGATAFQEYGQGVVGYAWDIARVANAFGAQMKVASTGLTSVRNAMPPRDDRAFADQKRPDKLTAEGVRQDNPEYQKALQVEKDRQEAINQMNRLGSYYTVSQSTLASQEMPPPPKSYKAPVPRPRGQDDLYANSNSATSRDDLSQSSPRRVIEGETGTSETSSRTRTESPGRAEPIQDPGTSIQIDSVKTPTAPPTTPTATPPTTVTGTPPITNTGPVPPMIGLGTPPRTGGPRVTGTTGVPRPTTAGPNAVGRAGQTSGSPVTGRAGGTTGRATGAPGGTSSTPAGRAGTTGGRQGPMGTPANTAGRSGVGGARGQSPVVGRPGGTGQPVGGRSGGPNGPRGGRADGIVGGTQRSAGGNAGSRIPKGTVIGGEGPAAGRSTAARPSQSGVVGANSGDKGARPVGRGTPSTNGVVGTPRAAGAPFAGGRGNQRPSGDDRDREGSTRPDYLTEDEETWANRRRGAVPPVID
ncbi:hypothetical protein [Streptomyces vilmorinianum]|uniref:hypothetical protein n=1 Tax=Streptomyces vilmorinianum TaxID=3051092 RepID=UPI00158647A4|nr:hypothetical protein [Streptomyces vilmorinianum]